MKNNRKNNKDTQVLHFKFMGFSDKANMTVNKAIRYSEQLCCSDVNTTHIFLALYEHCGRLKKDLDDAGVTFDELFMEYESMVEEGDFGFLDSSNIAFTPDYFSEELYVICSVAAQKAFSNNRLVSCDDLYELIIEGAANTESLLSKLLEAVGLDVDALFNENSEYFEIPEELADFVEDLNSSDSIRESTISGVDNYINELFEVLSRKIKANPCLVGEAGVGKTSIVNGLVQRIVKGKAPDEFKDTHVCYINGALLTSGTKYRGDFEARMQLLVEWAAYQNVVLFLDEIHTFINSGKTGDGSADTAGNIIKRYLSDGSIKIIGATTTKEYHKYIEGDKAFNRRLQLVEVKEPSLEDALKIVKSCISDYEKYHKVKISSDIVEKAVKYTDKYMKNSCLPDKAFTVLDQASAKTKLSNRVQVTEKTLLDVISKVTGIDINKLGEQEIKNILNLDTKIKQSLIGQDEAVKIVHKAVKRAKAGVREENKPLASFLFVGPTGVGKTELCKVLSKELGLSKESFIKIDMSEYNDKVSINKFIGSSPGYVGYDEGGYLIEKVKHNPYSLILFDEIEKAHPDVFNVFLQLLDEGRLTDAHGETADFTNCIVVMTSNAGYGADGMNKKSLGFSVSEEVKDYRQKEKIALNALESTFKPEFLNRLDNIVIFEKLGTEQCLKITELAFNKLSERIYDNSNIKVDFCESVIEHVAEKGYSDKYGARNIKRCIQDTVEDLIADKILSGELNSGDKCCVKYIEKEVVVCKTA